MQLDNYINHLDADGGITRAVVDGFDPALASPSSS